MPETPGFGRFGLGRFRIEGFPIQHLGCRAWGSKYMRSWEALELRPDKAKVFRDKAPGIDQRDPWLRAEPSQARPRET